MLLTYHFPPHEFLLAVLWYFGVLTITYPIMNLIFPGAPEILFALPGLILGLIGMDRIVTPRLVEKVEKEGVSYRP